MTTRIPIQVTPGANQVQLSALVAFMPAFQWRLPPRKQGTYPCGNGLYGPQGIGYNIGNIFDTEGGLYHGCVHNTMDGMLAVTPLNKPPKLREYGDATSVYEVRRTGADPFSVLGTSYGKANVKNVKVGNYGENVLIDNNGQNFKIPRSSTAVEYTNARTCEPQAALTANYPTYFVTTSPQNGKPKLGSTTFAIKTEVGVSTGAVLKFSRRTTFALYNSPYPSNVVLRGQKGLMEWAIVEENIVYNTMTYSNTRGYGTQGTVSYKYEGEKLLMISSPSAYKVIPIEGRGNKTFDVILYPLSPAGGGHMPDFGSLSHFCETTGHKMAADSYSEKDMHQAVVRSFADVKDAFNSNNLENLSGLKDAGSILNPLVEGHKALKAKNFGALGKAFAAGYLAYSFAIAPTFDDAKDWYKHGLDIAKKALKPPKREKRVGSCHKSVQIGTILADVSYWSTVYLQPSNDAVSRLLYALQRFRLNPSLSNYWDLLPMSFVVDWFVNVSDILEEISNMMDAITAYNLQVRFETYKFTCDCSDLIQSLAPPETLVSGSLTYRYYSRTVTGAWPSISDFDLQVSGDLSARQKLTGAALLTNFMK